MAFKSYVKQVKSQINTRAVTAMREKVHEIAMGALRQTPVDNGELIDNQKVDEQIASDGAVFVISYGNDAISKEYAVIQHENPYYNHPVGNYKYLEAPFNEIAPTIYDAIKKALS